ncbi:hypothetical protein M422DRAFT_781333 [Sphaerobolus stellatus SS14]|uniref:Unplaced genomic scaffold SPHSTscaffold_83, whole genome shotgun sequence n=1 Tax=Sphaerobolus stellatus (strain SS14) TaxID=990650 RepID=A0A0C9U6Z9_SPHS4|nr:hypothetical protein M422DRAFT_781333 [Sphaerobolus stellatus SS14]
MLLAMQRYLIQGENDKAIGIFSRRMERVQPPKEESQDYYERAVSLFTHAWDFENAVNLVNKMIEEGLELKPSVCMTLLRGMRHQNPEHVEQVLKMFTSGAVQLDDYAFKAILDYMVLHRESADKIEKTFMIYKESRGEQWTAPASLYGLVIHALSTAGEFDRARSWLEEFRTMARLLPLTSPGRVDPANSATESEPDASAKYEKVKDQPQRKYVPISSLVESKLHLRYDSPRPREAPCYPFTAMVYGYSKSPNALPDELQWLFDSMREDNVNPDVEMCNILISTFFRWGWHDRALAVYDSMVSPSKFPLPNASTFRKMFIGLNPILMKTVEQRNILQAMNPRSLFRQMVTLDLMRTTRASPQRSIRSKSNIISTATYNAALGTFVASHDYAGAWVLLSYYSTHHLIPDKVTVRNVILGLLRRIQLETHRGKLRHVLWTDRFFGIHRSRTIGDVNRVLLADRLYTIARKESAEREEQPQLFPTYIIGSPLLGKEDRRELEFLATLLRAALRAELGFMPDDYSLWMRSNVTSAYLDALNAMTPAGRVRRWSRDLAHYRKISAIPNQDLLAINNAIEELNSESVVSDHASGSDENEEQNTESITFDDIGDVADTDKNEEQNIESLEVSDDNIGHSNGTEKNEEKISENVVFIDAADKNRSQ